MRRFQQILLNSLVTLMYYIFFLKQLYVFFFLFFFKEFGTSLVEGRKNYETVKQSRYLKVKRSSGWETQLQTKGVQLEATKVPKAEHTETSNVFGLRLGRRFSP